VGAVHSDIIGAKIFFVYKERCCFTMLMQIIYIDDQIIGATRLLSAQRSTIRISGVRFSVTILLEELKFDFSEISEWGLLLVDEIYLQDRT